MFELLDHAEDARVGTVANNTAKTAIVRKYALLYNQGHIQESCEIRCSRRNENELEVVFVRRRSLRNIDSVVELQCITCIGLQRGDARQVNHLAKRTRSGTRKKGFHAGGCRCGASGVARRLPTFFFDRDWSRFENL